MNNILKGVLIMIKYLCTLKDGEWDVSEDDPLYDKYSTNLRTIGIYHVEASSIEEAKKKADTEFAFDFAKYMHDLY